MAEVSRYGIIEAATDVDGVAFNAPSDSRLRVVTGRMALRGRFSRRELKKQPPGKTFVSR